jgi:hypothetical protein
VTVIRQPMRRIRACERFDASRSARWCAACGFARALHRQLATCSQCGGEFPSASGECFSHCDQHGGA